MTLREEAQQLCDCHRAKAKLAHVRWSVGDPPCRACLADVRQHRRAKMKR